MQVSVILDSNKCCEEILKNKPCHMCGTEHYLSDLEVSGLKVAEHSFEMNGRESPGQIVFRPDIHIWLLIIKFCLMQGETLGSL